VMPGDQLGHGFAQQREVGNAPVRAHRGRDRSDPSTWSRAFSRHQPTFIQRDEAEEPFVELDNL
jgi:hypothetical protein